MNHRCIISHIFENASKEPLFVEFIPQAIYDTLMAFLQPEVDISHILQVLNCFSLFLQIDGYTSPLFGMSVFQLCFTLDESLIDEALFQGPDSLQMGVIGHILQIHMLFFNNMEKEQFGLENTKTNFIRTS